MRFSLSTFILILFIASNSVTAGEVQRIKLVDGSIINAEVVSMQNGTYTFKSPSLGVFKIKAKQVKSISSLGMPALHTGSANQNLSKIQSTLKANPETMNLIGSLQNDPDMQAILSDPKILKDIKNGDYTALANNPKFRKLLNNPKIKQITNSVVQ